MSTIFKSVDSIKSIDEKLSADDIKTINGASIVGQGDVSVQSIVTGTIIIKANTDVPSGFLECNGAALSRTTYKELYDIIGTTYGAGDGSSTFNLPDLRGEFIRGWDNGRGVDTGRNIGTSQSDTIRNITGTFTDIRVRLNGITTTSGAFTSTNGVYSADSSNGSAITKNYNFDASNVVPTSNENRPRNISMMYCIKY